jgi:ATP-binding protein involved in chromosome partitioning
MSSITREKIIECLKSVKEGTLDTNSRENFDRGQNITANDMVSGISIEGGAVIVTLQVDPQKGKQMEPLRQAVEAALQKLDGVTSAMAILTAERNAPPQAAAPSSAPQAAAPSSGKLGTHKASSRPVAPQVKYIIAVASGKGGVGKSTVAANLALAFAAMGKKTGLLDADIYGASQPRMMGVRTKPLNNKDDMIIPPVAHGIKLMSMGFFVEETAPVIWRGPMVHSAIQQLLRDVEWGKLDVLVIDLPPGTGDAQLSIAQNVPLAGAVIVSTPQDIALSEGKKGLLMFQKVNVPVLGLIENMSYHICSHCGERENIFAHGGVREAAQALNVEFLGEIPLHIDVRTASDSGTPLVAAQKKHAISETFKTITKRLWEKMTRA